MQIDGRRFVLGAPRPGDGDGDVFAGEVLVGVDLDDGRLLLGGGLSFGFFDLPYVDLRILAGADYVLPVRAERRRDLAARVPESCTRLNYFNILSKFECQIFFVRVCVCKTSDFLDEIWAVVDSDARVGRSDEHFRWIPWSKLRG